MPDDKLANHGKLAKNRVLMPSQFGLTVLGLDMTVHIALVNEELTEQKSVVEPALLLPDVEHVLVAVLLPLVLHEFPTLDDARSFAGDPALAAAMARAGVVGKPTIEFYEPA